MDSGDVDCGDFDGEFDGEVLALTSEVVFFPSLFLASGSSCDCDSSVWLTTYTSSFDRMLATKNRSCGQEK